MPAVGLFGHDVEEGRGTSDLCQCSRGRGRAEGNGGRQLILGEYLEYLGNCFHLKIARTSSSRIRRGSAIPSSPYDGQSAGIPSVLNVGELAR